MSNTSTSSVRATKKMIPEIRFPEFVNEGEWEEKTLDKVVNNFVVPMRDKPKKLDGEIPWCRIEDFNGMYLSCSKSNQGVSLETIKEMNLKVYPVNTLLVSCSADLGRCAITQKPLVTNQTFIGLVPDIKKVNTVYLYYVMTNARNELNARSSGTTISYLSRQQFEKFEIQLPKPQEQQKIASCLSSLDEVIADHSQKLELLKDHKKGLMQKLFPQEGETVPKYRFPEFVNDGEWVEKTLGSVAEIVTGSTPSTIETINYNGTRLFVSPADINDNRYITQTKTTLSDIGFSKTRKIKTNSVLFVCIGSTIGKVAQNKFECATNQQLNSLIPYEENSSDFLYSILDNNSSKIASIAGNHAVPIINKTSFSAIKLSFPPKPNEQQKIASCLSALDDLITAQAEKIEQLKLHKKGLMQGLFPKINE